MMSKIEIARKQYFKEFPPPKIVPSKLYISLIIFIASLIVLALKNIHAKQANKKVLEIFNILLIVGDLSKYNHFSNVFLQL